MTQSLISRGFGESARYIQERTENSVNNLWRTHAFRDDGLLRDELAEVWEQSRLPDWDGYGALPISQETLRSAYCFLESLPLGSPAPSIGAEPDGQISLEWYRGPRRTLSVSVSDDAMLHYAALIGPNRMFGSEVFYGDVPNTILSLIQRVHAI